MIKSSLAVIGLLTLISTSTAAVVPRLDLSGSTSIEAKGKSGGHGGSAGAKRSPKHTGGPIVDSGPTKGQNRSRNKDGKWRKKRSDANLNG